MALTYTVVATIEKKGKQQLCVLPSTWVYQNAWLKNGADDGKIKELGNDRGFWPSSLNGSNALDLAMAGEYSIPTKDNAMPFRCIIKRRNIRTSEEVIILFIFDAFEVMWFSNMCFITGKSRNAQNERKTEHRQR